MRVFKIALLPFFILPSLVLGQSKEQFPATDIVITQRNGQMNHLFYMDGFFLKYKKGGCEVYVIESGSNAKIDYEISELDQITFTYENKNYKLKPFKTTNEKRYLLLDSVIITERITLLRTPGNDYLTQYYVQDLDGVVHPIEKSLNQLLVYLSCGLLNERHKDIENKFLTQKEIIKLIQDYERDCRD